MIGLNKIGLNQVQLNQLYLNTLCACQKSSGGDGFPRLPGDVTRWSFKGLTNEMMSKNPRLEDADHKGRFLTFKNFAWGGMSGCGGYSLSKETFSYTPDIYSFNFTDPEGGLKIFDVYFQLIGLEENSGVTFNLDIIESGTAKRIKRETYTKDGIYHFEYKSEDDAVRLYMIGYNGVGEDRTTFTVKILPYYAGALVFDGVDDYGICENLPILTRKKGYTVVALRHLLGNGGVMLSKRTVNPGSGAFVVDKDNNTVEYSYSFGAATKVSINRNNPFVYQTSNSYMGQAISPGYAEDNSCIIVGAGLINNSNSRITEYTKCSIHELVILDHDATEEELTKIKNYFIKTYPWLFFDQAWTVVGKSNEDTDRATIANITGNGNDLVLSNFGFAEGSGYGLYKQNFSKIQWTSPSARVEATKTNSSFNITEVKSIAIQLYYLSNINEVAFTVPSIKVRVVGLTDGQSVNYRYFVDGVVNHFLISSDGIYDLPAFEFPAKGDYYGFEFTKIQSSCNITIEQIPENEGYLVTDGVDDMITSSAFQMGKDFTIVGDWKFIDNKKSGTGLVKGSSFFIYNTMIGLDLYINSGSVKNSLDGIKSINAACSDGRAYDRNWNEILANTGNVVGSGGMLEVSSSGGRFDLMAFKNLAIYPRILSKNDCIKAYNYLQTLKAK